MVLAPARGHGLNPKYDFRTYVVGSANRFTHAASVSVAEHPGGKFNPLFIYGGVGLGKTHLLHAIGHRALELSPVLQVSYVTSEKFTNDLIASIRQQRTDDFRARYRETDILMIDDIQFIAGKESTQEEFFHTFNSLYQSGKAGDHLQRQAAESYFGSRRAVAVALRGRFDRRCATARL